jgi:HD-GYP domain-containing protein (c-di-GMP phosphodiesterase class II)
VDEAADAHGATAVRRAELIGVLSLATDLAMGQPFEHGLRTALVAVHVGRELGLDERTLEDVYYVSLLQYVGCTAESHLDAGFWGDEVQARSELAPALLGPPAELFATARRKLEATSAPRRTGAAPIDGPRMRGTMSEWAEGHCEVSVMLAERLALGIGVKESLAHLYERWDGHGFPGRIRGEEVPLPVRVMQVAHDADLHSTHGLERAVEVVRERSGHGLDPSIADAFLQTASESLAVVESPSIWEELLAAEPGRRPVLGRGELDVALGAIADFTDMKSPYFSGHSAGVARLAGEAATRLGLPERDRDLVRQAGLVHDVGRVAVPSQIWGKPDGLTRDELERVRLHPYHTERVLAPSAVLGPIGRIASLHHERLDGSGYHRGLSGIALTPVARLLAAADSYHAMTEPRPHRDALEPEHAAEALAADAREGRLDADAVTAVLAVSGHSHAPRGPRPAGLSVREVEVLSLLARGLVTKQIAHRLDISPKTADHHIQRIYTKAGVSTRAGAILFALQHDLVSAAAQRDLPL